LVGPIGVGNGVIMVGFPEASAVAVTVNSGHIIDSLLFAKGVALIFYQE